MVLSNPIFSSTGRVNSKVPYGGCKAEEAILPAPPAARVSDPKGIENERRICVHYLWSSVTILNLLFPISPFFVFGYYRLATLGPREDFKENNQGGVHSIQSFRPNDLERKECREELFLFHWFLKAINPRFPHINSPSRIGSASDDEPMRKLSLLLAPGY